MSDQQFFIWDQFCSMLDCQDYVFELMLSGWSDKEEWDGQAMWHVWEIREVQTGFWWGDVRERDKLEDLSIDGRIYSNESSKSRMGRRGLDGSGAGQGQMADTCECCNEPLGSIKCEEFLD
jgi:hypothetical protein